MLSKCLNVLLDFYFEDLYIERRNEVRWVRLCERLVLFSLIAPSSCPSKVFSLETIWKVPPFSSLVFHLSFATSRPTHSLSFSLFRFFHSLCKEEEEEEDQITSGVNRPIKGGSSSNRIEMKFLTRNRTKLPFSKPWNDRADDSADSSLPSFSPRLLLFLLVPPQRSNRSILFFFTHTIHQDESFLKTVRKNHDSSKLVERYRRRDIMQGLECESN